MAEAPQYRAMDAVLPNLQEATVPLGPARRPPRELQSWTGPRHDIEKAQPTRREMLSGKYYVKFIYLCYYLLV